MHHWTIKVDNNVFMQDTLCISGKIKLHGLMRNNSYVYVTRTNFMVWWGTHHMYTWQEQTSWFGEEHIICISGKNKLHGLVRNNSYVYVARTNFMVWWGTNHMLINVHGQLHYSTHSRKQDMTICDKTAKIQHHQNTERYSYR